MYPVQSMSHRFDMAKVELEWKRGYSTRGTGHCDRAEVFGLTEVA